MSSSAGTPAAPLVSTGFGGVPPGYKIEVGYVQVRECADALAVNARQSAQDNLNVLLETEINKVKNLFRIVSVHYSDSASFLRKNCVMGTVWYEALQKVSQTDKRKDVLQPRL